MSLKTDKHCWSEIGVWSSTAATCPVLNEVIHCRNCPVYTSQGRTLLERPVSKGLLEEWTLDVARTPQEAGEMSDSVLVFCLGEEHFALPTQFFEEVISNRSVHTIPHRTGKVIKGFVAFRGRLELCVSMSDLLGVERTLEGEDPGQKILGGSRILVISRGDDARFLFPVSAVLGTHRFPVNQLQAAFTHGANHVFAYLKGIFPYKDRTVGLMDPDLIFEALAKSSVTR